MVVAPESFDVSFVSEGAAADLQETLCYVDEMQCIPALSIFYPHKFQLSFQDRPTIDLARF
jgi:hypothetical protein